MCRLVICDLDGTLIDSRADLADSINMMLADLGMAPLDIDTVTSYVGNGARKLVERSLGGRASEIVPALELFRKYYSQNMKNKTCLYPTVRKGLENLSGSGVRMVVASNKPSVNCDEILDHLGVRSFFDAIYGAGENYALKPDPESINLAIEKTGSSRERSWIIGDSLMDLQAGRSAGIGCCYAEYGFFRLEKALFDFSADSFAKIADFVLSKDS